MQIDLANTLVHKVYFLLFYLFSLSPLWSTISLLPSLGRGRVRLLGCVLKRGGHTDKRVNHKVNFDFD